MVTSKANQGEKMMPGSSSRRGSETESYVFSSETNSHMPSPKVGTGGGIITNR